MLNSRDSTRCGCTPRIGNVADPVDIARAGVPCQPMWAGQFALVGSTTYCRLTAMTRAHFAEGQVLFREGDPADGVFRLLSGTVDILRELDGAPILRRRLTCLQRPRSLGGRARRYKTSDGADDFGVCIIRRVNEFHYAHQLSKSLLQNKTNFFLLIVEGSSVMRLKWRVIASNLVLPKFALLPKPRPG